MENLDLKCAETGRAIAEHKGIEEKLVTDALAVLEEQGVYAFFLYLHARGKEPGKKVSNTCQDFLRKVPAASPLLDNGNDVWEGLQKPSEDLDRLLFVRDLLRQILIYARYHMKAKGED